MKKTRILIADDEKALAAALVDTIAAASDLEVCGVAHDAASAVAAAAETIPDVVLMDVRMPGGGVAATTSIVAAVPSARVVGLSAREDAETVRQMIEAGAIGYLVKGVAENEILDAVRRAARGQLSLPGDLGTTLIRDLIESLRSRVESESTLRSSEERLRSLLDAMPDAVLIVASDGRIETVNATTSRMFGYSQAELVGVAVEKLVPERFQARHRLLVAGYRQHPRPRPIHSGLQLFGKRKDGAEFPVEIALSPTVGAHGMEIVVAIRETAELNADELARRKREEVLRGVLESAPDAMVAVDSEGLIHVVNGQAERLFGYAREELLGMSVDQLVPESLRAGHAGHRAKYLRNPQLRPMGLGLELYGRRRDGSEFPVDISLNNMQTSEGILVVAAVRDVSERKQMEKRLAETQQTAEHRRQMSLLVHAQEEERRKIAADIHDDSIQAMTATSLRLQQLRRRLADPEQLALLTKLDEAVRESIIRLRRMMFDLRPVALDRSGLSAALRELLERMKIENGIDFTLEDRLLTEPAGELRVEMYRIAQEALVNVRKHAQATNVSVEVQRVQNGYQVRIADNGVGFDSRKSAQAANGHIGLMAMRERAEIAGGWLKVESAQGRGTAVEFWLPDDRELAPEG